MRSYAWTDLARNQDAGPPSGGEQLPHDGRLPAAARAGDDRAQARVEERGPIHSVSVANLKVDAGPDSAGGAGLLDQLTSDGTHAVDNLRWFVAARS